MIGAALSSSALSDAWPRDGAAAWGGPSADLLTHAAHALSVGATPQHRLTPPREAARRR